MTLNSDNLWLSLDEAKVKVLQVQQKLHRWSREDPEKRFDDLYNLVHDRATLLVAWHRVRSNRGSRTAGIDGKSRWFIEHRRGVLPFLEDLRSTLKQRTYRPLPVRERAIPKAGGKVRYLGIPTVRDRVVQMALKLILEPIFEVDFSQFSYGYRPVRRTHDAIAEIARYINPTASYDHVVEGDIKACFDNVHHGILMQQFRRRIHDRKVNNLIKAFLRSGVMKAGGLLERSVTGTPQGGIISPLLTNIYLSVLDRHFERAWKYQIRKYGNTAYHRKQGHAAYRLVRYADDFVILLRGTREQAENLRDEVAQLLRDELKMELSIEKTLVTHVDEGFDFLGHRIRRVLWNGRKVVWTYPSKRSLETIKRKVKNLTGRSTTNWTLENLLRQLNPVLRGWSNHFRYGCSKRTLSYLSHYTWWRVFRWLRKKHRKRKVSYLKRRYCQGGWHFQEGGLKLFRPEKVKVERYRYRGTRILLPWMEPDELGKVGRFARADVNEPYRLDRLQDSLAIH